MKLAKFLSFFYLDMLGADFYKFEEFCFRKNAFAQQSASVLGWIIIIQKKRIDVLNIDN